MTEREAALLDLSFAHGMQLALAMTAQGADARVRATIERLTLGALRVLRDRPPVGETEGNKEG